MLRSPCRWLTNYKIWFSLTLVVQSKKKQFNKPKIHKKIFTKTNNLAICFGTIKTKRRKYDDIGHHFIGQRKVDFALKLLCTTHLIYYKHTPWNGCLINWIINPDIGPYIQPLYGAYLCHFILRENQLSQTIFFYFILCMLKHTASSSNFYIFIVLNVFDPLTTH